MTGRPPLPDVLPEGSPVFILPSPNDARRGGGLYSQAREGRVVKAARVWITIETLDRPGRAYRMRRDTQDENTEYSGGNYSFRTPEQFLWERRRFDARAFLHEQGITIEPRSPWRERLVELADLIKEAS